MISNSFQDEHVLSLSDQVIEELSSFVYLAFVQILSYEISSSLKTVYQHICRNGQLSDFSVTAQ